MKKLFKSKNEKAVKKYNKVYSKNLALLAELLKKMIIYNMLTVILEL